MSNLTFDTKLVRPHKAEPLEGHTVVVLERVGEEGEKFHSLLEAGADRPRQSVIAYLLGRPSVYFAFAVDSAKMIPLEFTVEVKMAEIPHVLTLHFEMWFRVADPQALVSAREHDPLGRLRARVEQVITREIARMPWSVVCGGFVPAGEPIVASNFSDFRSFARDAGLSIVELELKAELPPGAVATAETLERIRARGQIKQVALQEADAVAAEKRRLREASLAAEERERGDAARVQLQNTFVQGTIRTIEGMISEATTLEEIHDLQLRLSGLLNGTQALSAGHPHRTQALAPGNGSASQPLPAISGELPGVLSDVMSLTEQFPDRRRRRIRALLLHFVASMVADDSQQTSVDQAGHARRARIDIDASTNLPPARLTALQELADPQSLHDRLYRP